MASPAAATTVEMAAVDLYDVLTNVRPAAQDDPDDDFLLPITGVQVRVEAGRLHTAATDRFRIYRDHAPISRVAGPAPTGPVMIAPGDVDTALAILRRGPFGNGRVALVFPAPGAPTSLLTLITFPPASTRLAMPAAPAPWPFLANAVSRFDAAGWTSTGAITLNPRLLPDPRQMRHHGGVVDGPVTLRFRPDGLAIRAVIAARPSFTADVMPCVLPADRP